MRTPIESLPERYRAIISPDDFHLPRLRYVDPTPYSRDEFDQTNAWLVSWGLVDANSEFERQVDNRIRAGFSPNDRAHA